MKRGGFRLGIDVGGTFTDFVLVDNETGALYREKCLTTPDDPVRGMLEGIRRLIASGAVQPRMIGAVSHATTLITNTLIERKGARTGLLATAGFRDLIELGSDMRYDMYDLAIEFPEPLARRADRRDVRERLDAAGSVVQRVRETDVRREMKMLVKQGVTSVAVCFLHSYLNSVHERAVRAQLEREFPHIPVSLSSAVAPEIREYERTVTTVANAYVKPAAQDYLGRVEQRLREHGVEAPILVMLSNGGMTTPRVAAEIPIRLVESGPAAGVLSACHAGARIGHQDLLAFDMGGTTAKACFIDAGKPAFTGMFEAARVRRQFRGSGMPLKIPSVEMIEIGAGGGSIARLDGTGLLKVGPDSAGAEPGPACYARGGDAPTVTDADLLLGYLDPSYFLGGEMPLDRSRAERAIGALAARCGMDVDATAAGIVQVVNQNMATAVRIHAAERGKDYRRYALFAFGGAGPVHAYEIARTLRLQTIICPPGAGTSSAFGLLAAPVAVDLSRSYNAPLADIELDRLNAAYAEMENEARAMLADAGVKRPQFVRTVDMRYVGQGFELAATVPNGRLTRASMGAVESSFQDAYRSVYGELPGALPVEAITWRLRASGPDPELSVSFARSAQARNQVPARRAYYPELKQFVDTPVYDRYALQPGTVLRGPAIVEERESTAVIGPAATAKVDEDLNLVITLEWR